MASLKWIPSEKVFSEPRKHSRELLYLHKQTSHPVIPVPEYF